MNKAERKKQELKQRLFINQANAKIQSVAQKAYDDGHRDGFHGCLSIILFAVMETTNYKRDGLRKIWQRTLDIAEALESEKTGLTMDDIKYALLEEADTVVDPEFMDVANQYLKENGGKVKDPKYKAIVQEAMKKYEQAVESEEDGRVQS